jgi:hypothetical protein
MGIAWDKYPWRGWSPVGTYTGDPRSGYQAPLVYGFGVYTAYGVPQYD